VQTVYRYWAWVVVIAVVIQVGLAGYGAFYAANKVEDATIDEDTFMDGFGLHAGIGYLVVLFGLVLLILAFAARVGRERVIRSAALFGLLILQVLLAWFGFEVPAIGFFHPVNALLIVGLSGSIAWTSWRGPAAVETAAARV
jgi:hypothetical protein